MVSKFANLIVYFFLIFLLTHYDVTGNKTDRDDREIPTSIGMDFAKQHDMYFLETSAKQSENVERLFYDIAAELIEVCKK